MNAEAFRTELEALLNKHSMENGSDTPDHVLAKYLAKCLTTFDETVVARDRYYGKRATGISMQPIQDGETQPIEQILAPEVGGDGACSASLTANKPDHRDGADNVHQVGPPDPEAQRSRPPLKIDVPIRDGWVMHIRGACTCPSTDFSKDCPIHRHLAGTDRGVLEAHQKKVEPGDVAAARGVLYALSVTQQSLPLRDDEERDWRTLAFAKTQEGSVWERASVQRLFATIDQTERQLQESFDKYGAALEDMNTLRKKCQDYEREYILPCFQWARELGVDLERMVLDNPGHNCVELLVSTLRRRFE